MFARQDITRDPPFSKLDIVLCRNLLIYLGLPSQRKMISIFHYALNPNGFLVLGRSETIGSYADLFATFDNRSRTYRRKPGAVSTRWIEFRPGPPPRIEAVPPGAAGQSAGAPGIQTGSCRATPASCSSIALRRP